MCEAAIAAGVSNHQIVQSLDRHPKLRDYLGVGGADRRGRRDDQSAAGASSYLVAQANRRADLAPWFDGVTDGAGLVRSDPRLLFRRVMFNMARRHAGQVPRRRDNREHVGLYLTEFNAWATGAPIRQLRFTPPRHRPSRR